MTGRVAAKVTLSEAELAEAKKEWAAAVALVGTDEETEALADWAGRFGWIVTALDVVRLVQTGT